ncbi:MAG: nickel pincer cofactor biosynthesis protein LarB [Nitrospirales bacterium]|nr:nickel pincer cofactor biosynthesis protein LarB [Nitrospirales bacterium]
MDPRQLKKLLAQVKNGRVSIESAMARLALLPSEDLGFASVDHHRSLRQGFPEVILCEGKTATQVVEIATSLRKAQATLLATRVNSDIAKALKRWNRRVVYHELPRLVVLQSRPVSLQGDIVLVTAGTADLPVAEEMKICATVMGSRVHTVYDVGVAGLHRLVPTLDRLRQARVVVVVAGMEGALPSVIGGLVQCPLIAVPTSQGYGANFGGLSALLAMLNSCAGGVGVVNIDNGFGAACLAHRINLLGEGA